MKTETFLKLLCDNLFRAIFLQDAIYQQNKNKQCLALKNVE